MRIPVIPWLFLIYLLKIFFGADVVLVSGQCQSDQQSLLLQLKKSLIINETLSKKLVRWNQNEECCRWSGVTCKEGRVTGLDLSSESITGGIENSGALFSLQYLERLNLADNRFKSQIPPALANLTSLTHLNLSNAAFSGQIPIAISRMTRLVTLDFSTVNYFFGDLPLKVENSNLAMLVQNISELTELYLDGVLISAQGNEWCQALSSLHNLRVLSLANCDLSGPIDSSLMQLRSLSIIRLDNNNLSGPVPEFFLNFSNLTSLHLSFCGLSGIFPEKIIQVQTLKVLDVSSNMGLSGSLPEFPQNGSLQTLVLSHTNFSGVLPNSIGKLRQLSRVEFVGCNFSGLIPSSMANLTKLVYLDFSFNRFIGPIPSFSSSKNLEHINLAHNRLNGSILSTDWGGLSNLVDLDLRNNSLSGNIPMSLFGIPSLQQLQLSHNQFSGRFDEFSNASSSQLNTLDLSSNKLQGLFPISVFGFQGLKILTLSSNNFSGTLQLDMIHQLRNLSTLDLSYNSLLIYVNGTNSTLSSLPQITTLKLASCKLRTFPDFLKNQSKLTYLDLSNNQIQGEIPNWIWTLKLVQLNLSCNYLVNKEGPFQNLTSTLSILDLHSNKLQGPIPFLPQFATYLDYSSNHFSSIIPANIGNYLSYTIFFSLSSNNFYGSIPDSICHAAYIKVLDLSNNSLSGGIPPCLTVMTETLAVLNLGRNNLSGNISNSFPGKCDLRTLDLSQNVLGETIPQSLANCTMLEVLDLGNNQIYDVFPCWLKNISNLRVLVLRSNKFHGHIGCGRNHGNWSVLQIVDLAVNNFSGKLPQHCFKTWQAMFDEGETQPEFSYFQFPFLRLSQLYYQDAVTVTSKGLEMKLVKILTLFTSIDFSCNNFEGPIPEVMGEFKALRVFNLSHNALTGPIPSSLGNLRVLESLDLSQNNLNGTIPTQLANLSFLSVLNLSYNQLVGSIPTGTQLQSFSGASFEGNRLCGPPLTKKCNTSNPQPSAPENQYRASRVEFDWQFIFTGLGFGVGAAMVVAPLIFWKKGRKWYDRHVDKFLMVILPMMGLIYRRADDWELGKWDNMEEKSDITEDYDDDDDEDEGFNGWYCVFCSKLDISRKRAIHDPKCTCHLSPPISSSSCSTSSSFSLMHQNF